VSDYTLEGWQVAEEMIEHADRVLLYGPPGTGKTTAAVKHATGYRGVQVITMTEETPADSIKGHQVPIGPGEFGWMDACGITAWRNGDRLIVNELDKACGDAMDLMHVICDDQEVASLTLPNIEKELVTPHYNFQVVATMNGLPESLPDAIQDRFSVQVLIREPHPNALASLPGDLRRVAAKTAVIEDYTRRIGIRKWKAFAKLRDVCSSKEIAAQGVFGESWRSLLGMIEMANTDEYARLEGQRDY
jgi:MoxR-like ATPase